MWPVTGLPGDKKNKGVTLYDAGGWYLLVYLGFAFILGTLLDFGWNFLVLHLTLRRLSLAVKRASKLIYTIMATIIGLGIDWLYYQIVWGQLWRHVPPLFSARDPHPCLEAATILAPMLLIALVNYVLARMYLKLETRQAAIVGAAMGFFTAPWIVVITVIISHYN